MVLSCGFTIAAISSAFFLLGCSAGNIDLEIGRSARWDAYKANQRDRRNTQTMEWQDKRQFPTCTLSDVRTFDRWARRASLVLATPQNQGRCGSCWAFAATHVFTDYLRLQGQAMAPTFSQDHLTKCISPFRGRNQGVGNGCCGGNAYYAFKYFSSVGAVPGTCLPYTLSGYSARDLNNKRENPLQCPQSCTDSERYEPASNRIQGFEELNENHVIAALDTGRPVYASMEVRNDFQDYRCGVFCDDPIAVSNHAVEIVDYSRADPNYRGIPYWVVKNSWGNTWGEDGYFRIARGRNQLRSFVTISETLQTSPPALNPSLATPTCDAQVPDNESDNELLESAAEFAVEQLNNRSEVRCADDATAVATLSLSRVINGTIQVVDGFAVQLVAEVNVEGCVENRAVVMVTVMMDTNDNFSLVEYSYIVSSGEPSGCKSVTAIAMFIVVLAASVIIVFA